MQAILVSKENEQKILDTGFVGQANVNVMLSFVDDRVRYFIKDYDPKFKHRKVENNWSTYPEAEFKANWDFDEAAIKTEFVELTPKPVYGKCMYCGAIEAKLTVQIGTRDYSSIGESAKYPIGSGCEFCD